MQRCRAGIHKFSRGRYLTSPKAAIEKFLTLTLGSTTTVSKRASILRERGVLGSKDNGVRWEPQISVSEGSPKSCSKTIKEVETFISEKANHLIHGQLGLLSHKGCDLFDVCDQARSS